MFFIDVRAGPGGKTQYSQYTLANAHSLSTFVFAQRSELMLKFKNSILYLLRTDADRFLLNEKGFVFFTERHRTVLLGMSNAKNNSQNLSS